MDSLQLHKGSQSFSVCVAQNAAEIHLKNSITTLSSIWNGIKQKVAILFEHELQWEKREKGRGGKYESKNRWLSWCLIFKLRQPPVSRSVGESALISRHPAQTQVLWNSNPVTSADFEDFYWFITWWVSQKRQSGGLECQCQEQILCNVSLFVWVVIEMFLSLFSSVYPLEESHSKTQMCRTSEIQSHSIFL